MGTGAGQALWVIGLAGESKPTPPRSTRGEDAPCALRGLACPRLHCPHPPCWVRPVQECWTHRALGVRGAVPYSSRPDVTSGDEWPTVARPAGGRDTSRGSPAMTITRVFPPCPPAVSAARGPGASLPSVQTRQTREE